MESVEITKDLAGNITGIRLEVQDNPEMAQELYKLVRSLENAKDVKRSIRNRAISQHVMPTKPLNPSSFKDLIEKAKASGEVSKEELLRENPSWQKIRKLSSQ
ncbi:MAG: hypothetical protein AAFY71_02410 [Bacteroidota bacterium]